MEYRSSFNMTLAGSSLELGGGLSRGDDCSRRWVTLRGEWAYFMWTR